MHKARYNARENSLTPITSRVYLAHFQKTLIQTRGILNMRCVRIEGSAVCFTSAVIMSNVKAPAANS